MHLPFRFKKILVVLSLLSLLGGFTGIIDSLRFRSPQKITYAQFVQRHPKEGWFDITDAQLDIPGAVLPIDRLERAYYVPLRGPGDSGQAGTEVVAFVNDEATVNQIDAFNNQERKTMTVWAEEHTSEVPAYTGTGAITSDVSGMVIGSDLSNGGEEGKILSDLNVAPDYTMLGKDKHPSILLSLAGIAVGLLLGLVALISFGFQPSLSATKEYAQSVRDERRRALAAASRPYAPPAQGSYPSYPAQSPQPPQFPFAQGPQGPPVSGASSPPQVRSQPGTVAPPPAEEPSEDREKAKEAAELAKLREMKPFDPFGEEK